MSRKGDKERRDARKLAGLCVACGEPAVEIDRCAVHALAFRKYHAAWEQRQKGRKKCACGAPISRRAPKCRRCAQGIREEQRKPITEVCRACGVVFEVLRNKRQYIPPNRRVPFCSPLCAQAALYQARAMKDSIVRFQDDGIFCLLCDKLFEANGTHFHRVHGLDLPPRASKTARQIALGAPAASRFASPRILALMSERALAPGGIAEVYGGPGAMVPGPQRQPNRGAALSMGQQAALRSNGIAQRERLILQNKSMSYASRFKAALWTCRVCGKEEMRTAPVELAKKVCSQGCAGTYNQRSPSPLLVGHRERARNRSVEAHTKACQGCGRTFVQASHLQRDVRFCSTTCRGLGMRKPKQFCSESDCQRPVIAKGRCTMHYQRLRKGGGALP